MSTTTISTAVAELVDLALAGKWEIAFSQFYHPDFIKTDLNGEPVQGMEKNIENGRIFSSKVSNIREFSCAGTIVHGNRSFIIWAFDFDVDGQPFKVTEVAIQDWEEGKIVQERFFA